MTQVGETVFSLAGFGARTLQGVEQYESKEFLESSHFVPMLGS